MNAFFVFTGWPVKKTPFIHHIFPSFIIHFRHKKFQQSCQVELLIFQVGKHTLIKIPVVLHDDPPHRVSAYAIHPAWKGGIITAKVKAFRYDVMVTKDSIDGHHLGMHIPHPYHAVPLDAVPQVILHVQVNGVSTRKPYPVEECIAAPERTKIGDITYYSHGPYLLKSYTGTG